MIFSFNARVLLLALLTSQSISSSSAFVPAFSASTYKPASLSASSTTSTTTTKLFSSNGGGNLDDDEISKLIGKRNQIKRQKKPEPPTPEDFMPDDVQDFDLESLPEFKTSRPSREGKRKEKEAAEAAEANKRKQDDDVVLSIDYKMDYDDENDFHVPNRIGFSTAGWGDVTQGFVPEGKLTKRMIKAGKYVPGDCQMVYNKLLQGGISLVETSSSYGKASRPKQLSAHDILSQSIAAYEADANVPLVVETLPRSWFLPISSVMKKTAEKSCERLKIDTVDLVQVSKRIPFITPLLSGGLTQVVEQGSCNYVGAVGIVQRSSLQRFADACERKGSTLTSNAFEFSLTKNELMIQHCKDMGIVPLILNPLDGGLASGVYTATNPSGGDVSMGSAKFKFEQLEKLQPLHSILETVSERARTRVSRELRDLQDRFRSKYGPPVCLLSFLCMFASYLRVRCCVFGGISFNQSSYTFSIFLPVASD